MKALSFVDKENMAFTLLSDNHCLAWGTKYAKRTNEGWSFVGLLHPSPKINKLKKNKQLFKKKKIVVL